MPTEPIPTRSSHDELAVTVNGGRRYYGQAIGIILYDTIAPRIPGDVGNASTFDFPVRLKYADGLQASWIIKKHPDRQALPILIQAAQEFEKDGVRAITTSCGFTAVFQEEMAEAVSIPVFASSLIQVPMVHKMLGKNQKVGIITANSDALGEEHLEAAGIDSSIQLVIRGIQEGIEWRRREAELRVNPPKLEEEIVQVAVKLIRENRDVGAIVLECTQLPSFASAIQLHTNLPIFDVYTLARFIYESLFRTSFDRHRCLQILDGNRFV